MSERAMRKARRYKRSPLPPRGGPYRRLERKAAGIRALIHAHKTLDAALRHVSATTEARFRLWTELSRELGTYGWLLRAPPMSNTEYRAAVVRLVWEMKP